MRTRSASLACLLLVVGLAATLPAWLSAAPPAAEKLPTQDLKKTEQKPQSPDEELLPPINVTVRSQKGSIGQLLMGDRQVDNVQVLRGEVMSMTGGVGPEGDSGFEVKLVADGDLKMGELLRVIDAAAGYRDRNGKFRPLILGYRLAAPLDDNPTKGKSSRLERGFRVVSLVGGS